MKEDTFEAMWMAAVETVIIAFFTEWEMLLMFPFLWWAVLGLMRMPPSKYPDDGGP